MGMGKLELTCKDQLKVVCSYFFVLTPNNISCLSLVETDAREIHLEESIITLQLCTPFAYALSSKGS